MKYLIFLLTVNLIFFVRSQTNFDGVWQGVLLKDGAKQTEALIFYVTIKNKSGVIEGKSREEYYGTDFYAIQPLKGSIKEKHIEFKQTVIESKKGSSKITWCSSDFTGDYVDSMGYIYGTYKSSTCKRNVGKFVLYRSKAVFSESALPTLGHAWRDLFLDDIKMKRKAPELRELERQNFKFQPVYFDHDKAEIREEYTNYLKEMIRVVNGHSDLRIQITGHTDAVGSLTYNEALSKRRAESIKKFFQDNGFDLKKLIIDFKGEQEPIDRNDTEEGKQKNRRVDFKFI